MRSNIEGVLNITISDLDDGFYIADDGPSILNNEQKRYSTRDTRPATKGLGLNVVKGIVEAHGWQVRLTESKAGGVRVRITDVELVE